MSFHGRTYLEHYSTPDDVGPAFPEPLLARLFAAAKGPVVESCYNYSLPVVWQGTFAAVDRGLPVLGVIDHVQWCGPSCKKAAAPYLASHAAWWKEQHIAIGTTQVHGAIEHKKQIVFNAPILGYDVPDADFETLDDALSAGYPILWTGSYNFSQSAKDQANDVFVIPSKAICADAVQSILAQREWILEHEQRYQPFPLSQAA